MAAALAGAASLLAAPTLAAQMTPGMLGGCHREGAASGGMKFRSDDVSWAQGAGIEATVTNRSSFVGHIDDQRYFGQRFGNDWLCRVGENHRFGDQVSMLGPGTLRDPDSILYGSGIGMKY